MNFFLAARNSPGKDIQDQGRPAGHEKVRTSSSDDQAVSNSSAQNAEHGTGNYTC